MPFTPAESLWDFSATFRRPDLPVVTGDLQRGYRVRRIARGRARTTLLSGGVILANHYRESLSRIIVVNHRRESSSRITTVRGEVSNGRAAQVQSVWSNLQFVQRIAGASKIKPQGFQQVASLRLRISEGRGMILLVWRRIRVQSLGHLSSSGISIEPEFSPSKFTDEDTGAKPAGQGQQ